MRANRVERALPIIRPAEQRLQRVQFTNWTVYDPFFAEARAALKRFDGRISRVPAFPHIIMLRPQVPDFIHACRRAEVKVYLERMPPASRKGLRAVFLLAGTRKQEKSWSSSLGCYGMYWNSCVFLCAHPFHLRSGYTLDHLRQFYLDDVLVHEVPSPGSRSASPTKRQKRLLPTPSSSSNCVRKVPASAGCNRQWPKSTCRWSGASRPLPKAIWPNFCNSCK